MIINIFIIIISIILYSLLALPQEYWAVMQMNIVMERRGENKGIETRD